MDKVNSIKGLKKALNKKHNINSTEIEISNINIDIHEINIILIKYRDVLIDNCIIECNEYVDLRLNNNDLRIKNSIFNSSTSYLNIISDEINMCPSIRINKCLMDGLDIDMMNGMFTDIDISNNFNVDNINLYNAYSIYVVIKNNKDIKNIHFVKDKIGFSDISDNGNVMDYINKRDL